MRWEMKRPALVGSREHPLLQTLCERLALGYVGATSSCTVHVWGCLQSPVGRGSGRREQAATSCRESRQK
jgi:hypothetical protein